MASERAFLGISALLFAAGAAVTIVCCASMSAMGGMPMPGGWTMSMAWMRMPGQTWLRAAGSFLGMWVVMMVAMMLPSLVPMLWRYRQAVGRTVETRFGRLTALVGAGYFFVWTVFGMAVFPSGAAMAAIEMQQPALARGVPIAFGVVVVVAGALQLTAWKARHLGCCREAPGSGRTLPADAATAFRAAGERSDEHHRPLGGNAIGGEEDAAGDVAQHPARLGVGTDVREQHIPPLLKDEQRRERGRVIRVPNQPRPPRRRKMSSIISSTKKTTPRQSGRLSPQRANSISSSEARS